MEANGKKDHNGFTRYLKVETVLQVYSTGHTRYIVFPVFEPPRLWTDISAGMHDSEGTAVAEGLQMEPAVYLADVFVTTRIGDKRAASWETRSAIRYRYVLVTPGGKRLPTRKAPWVLGTI